MTISRLRFSMPVLMMLAMESGSAMYNAADIIYLMEHNPPRAADVLLEIDPSRVHVGNPKDFSGEERLLAETVNFMKEKKKSQCEIFLEGAKFLQQKKNEGVKEVTDSAVLDYLSGKNINVDKNTFPDEFRDYVEYLNDYYPEDKADDLPVPMNKDVEERIKREISEYVDEPHTIGDLTPEEAKEALYEIVIYLKEKDRHGSKEVTSDDIKDDLDIKITFDELDEFVKEFQEKGEISSAIKVEMTEKERIYDEVEKYTRTIGNFTDDEAYELVKYLKGSGISEVTSKKVLEDLKGTTPPKISAEATINYKQLDDFVRYLQSEAIQEIPSTITVAKTDAEKIDYAVDTYISEYLPENSITGLPISTDAEKGETKTKLEAIVAYMENPGKDSITSDDVKSNVEGLSGSTINYKDLEQLKTYLHDQGKDLGVTIERTIDEKIDDAVAAYMSNHQVAGQTEEVLKEIVKYLKDQGSATIDRDDVKNYLVTAGKIPSVDALALGYQNLLDLKACSVAEDIEITVKIAKTREEMSDDERIRDEIDEYLDDPTIEDPTIEGLPTDREEAKDLLTGVVAYLKRLGEPAIVRTSDIYEHAAVTFTYLGLSEFVNYLKGINEIPSGIEVKRTTAENVAEYLKDTNHTVNGEHKEDEATKTALCAAITILNNKAKASQEAEVVATTDDVKNKVVFTFEELGEFVEYMQKVQEKEVSDKIKVEMTTAERIRVEVDEYYAQSGSPKVGNLTVDQAYDLAMYMRGRTAETTITSDSVKEDVEGLSETTFTYDDLTAFVTHLNTKETAVGKEALKVTVKRTTKENAGEYLKVKNIASLPETTAEEIETAKTKLSEVVTILNNKAAASEEATVPATTDDVKNKVVFTFEELGEFVDYMQKDEVDEISDKIKVEMTYKEAVTDKIRKYTGAVWGLSAAEAYAIVEFLNRQDEGAKVNSDDVEKELKTKLGKDVDIKFSELNAFVEYLNGDLEKTITVVKTDAEKIDSAIAAYYPSHKISGLSDDDAKAALVEIAKHLKTLPPNWKTNSSTIMEELKATTPPKIPSTVNLTYEDMKAYIEALDEETYFENKPMIVEEELTLRQRIDALLFPETPEVKLDGVAYDSYRLDSLLTKDGAIDASDVKNTWADAITESFMPALSDANSSILKQDSSIQPAIAVAAETETQSRIATTTDGSIPTLLKTDIENYVDALYEAEMDDMNTALNSILSSNNTLSALNTTESRSTINSKILTDVTANGDAMNAKTNSIYADLPEIVEAIRRYAATYHLTESAQVDQIMLKYPGTEARVIIREYLANKIFTESDANAKGYLKQYLKDEYVMDSDASYAPSGAINTIYTNIKTGSTASDVTSRLNKINNGIIPVLNNNYIRAFADTEAKTTDGTACAALRDAILIAFWNKSYEGTNLGTDGGRRGYVWGKTYPDQASGVSYRKYAYLPTTPTCSTILNYLQQNNRNAILSTLNNYKPLSAGSDFNELICNSLFSTYAKQGASMDPNSVFVAQLFIWNIGTSPHVWVPSIDLREARQSWFDYLGNTWTNSNIPAPITSTIQTKIQNALKNLGSGKTLKAGLKSQFNVSGTSALVNDENEYPVANGTSEIDNYKYTDAFDNKTKVNILDYTYDKLIGDVRAIDAKTAYEVLKARANATNDAAIDSLVSSDLREALRDAIANVTTPADVQSAASQVLSSEIASNASKEESTSDAVKDKYAKIYRSVNIGSNAVNLSGATNVTNINTAFDNAIYNTMNGYLAPNGTAGIFEGVEGGVTGFIDAVYGSNDEAKRAAVRQVAMNWITAREEEFKAAKIAEMLNDIKETRNPSDRLKYQIEAYLSSHDIASLPVEDDAAKAKLVQVVEHLQNLGENETVKTSDITVVAFTFPELKAFVDYFKGKEGIPSTISAVKTEEQKLDSAVEDYYPTHPISGLTGAEAKAALVEIAKHLKTLPDGTTIKSSTIMEELQNAGKIPSTVNLSHDDLEAFVEALNKEGFGLDITIAEEEDTLRGEINTLVANYVPTATAGSTNFNDAVFDSLIAQKKEDGAPITEEQVRNAWTAQIRNNLNKATLEEMLWEKDSAVELEVSDKVNTALNSRIATTDDGKVPDSLASYIDDYLNALYEAADMDSALDSLLSDENKLSALNTTESRQEIDSEILTKVTANGDAMNEKIDSVYADLYNCVDPIRRYAATWRLSDIDQGEVDLFLQTAKEGGDPYNEVSMYLRDKIKDQNKSFAEVQKYIEAYLFRCGGANRNRLPNNLSSRDIQLLNECYSSMRGPTNNLIPSLGKYFEEYFKYGTVEESLRKNRLWYLFSTPITYANSFTRQDIEALKTFVWKNNTGYNQGLELRNTNKGQPNYVWEDTNWDDPFDSFKTKIIKFVWDATYDDDKDTSAYNYDHNKYLCISNSAVSGNLATYIKDKNQDSFISTLTDSYVPLAYSSNDSDKSKFKNGFYNYLINNKYQSTMDSGKVQNFYKKYVIECWLTDSIESSVEEWFLIKCMDEDFSGFFSNANIPVQNSISSKIQNTLKNVGNGNTIKSALKSQFSGTFFKLLVNDAFKWYIASGSSDINKYKFTDSSSSWTKVNMLDYTYDKLIEKVRAIDANTTYGILKTQADDKLDSAVGGLVPSDKVDAMKSEIKTVQSEVDVANAVYSVLEDSKSDTDAQNCVARIYRGRNVNGALGVVGNSFKEMIDANIAYDTLKYLRHDITLGDVTKIINVRNFVNRLDGSEELRSEVISNAIEAAINGFPAGDIADIINRII